MKRCPQCNRTYADEMFAFCLADGTLLSAPYDPHATLSLPTESKSDSASSMHINEPVIAININQQYPRVQNAEDLYHATRGIWRVDRQHAQRARYAFAVYQGEIKEVYEIDQWIPVSDETRAYWRKRESDQGRYFPLKFTTGVLNLWGN